jgi:hypothetical protein
MNEIRLEHPEFLALLDAVHASMIVGIAQDKLFPQDEEERGAVLRQGMAQLKKRGLLQADHQLHPGLLRLARIVAYPQIAFFIIRHVLALGPQLFLLYQSGEGMVEQTFPIEGVHRMAVLPDIPHLLTRAVQILHLPEQLPFKSSVEIAQEEFFQCDHLVHQNQREQALNILRHASMPFSEADALVAALQTSDFRGNVTLLKCADQTIVDARDIAIVQGRQTAWYAMQIVAGEPLLHIETVNAPTMQSLLSHCFVELTQASV